jgi:hypothetical protein
LFLSILFLLLLPFPPIKMAWTFLTSENYSLKNIYKICFLSFRWREWSLCKILARMQTDQNGEAKIDCFFQFQFVNLIDPFTSNFRINP